MWVRDPHGAHVKTCQVLLAGVSGGFSRGSPVFAPPTDWPVSYELKKKNLNYFMHKTFIRIIKSYWISLQAVLHHRHQVYILIISQLLMASKQKKGRHMIMVDIR